MVNAPEVEMAGRVGLEPTTFRSKVSSLVSCGDASLSEEGSPRHGYTMFSDTQRLAADVKKM